MAEAEASQHWDDTTYAIDTEKVIRSFDSNLPLFEQLIERFSPQSDNDLITVRKYRNAGAKYFAPPVPAILDIFRTKFDVTALHFGPYPMSEYFPLLVASRR
jgi:hypothetical protein